MGLLKKTEKAEPVAREEFEKLAAQLETFKATTALMFAAITIAAKASPGTPDANPRRRLVKLANAADLEPTEVAETNALLKRLDHAGDIESRREFAENQESTRPKRAEDFRGWTPL